ncbi:MAG: ChaN family lipoprotein, partial [Planctomycetota bacterium]
MPLPGIEIPHMVRTASSFAFVLAATAALAQEPRLLPTIEDATVVHASASGERLDWNAFATALAAVDVVFLGETHLDDTTHRIELRVLEDLLRLRGNKVVLSLEMFERDVQPALDAYCKGEIDEATFLHRSRPWGNYQSDYRPLIETAKAAGIKVVAANFPAML